MTDDHRFLEMRQKLAQVDQILQAMDTMHQLAERLRDEAAAIASELVVE